MGNQCNACAATQNNHNHTHQNQQQGNNHPEQMGQMQLYQSNNECVDCCASQQFNSFQQNGQQSQRIHQSQQFQQRQQQNRLPIRQTQIKPAVFDQNARSTSPIGNRNQQTFPLQQQQQQQQQQRFSAQKQSSPFSIRSNRSKIFSSDNETKDSTRQILPSTSIEDYPSSPKFSSRCYTNSYNRQQYNPTGAAHPAVAMLAQSFSNSIEVAIPLIESKEFYGDDNFYYEYNSTSNIINHTNLNNQSQNNNNSNMSNSSSLQSASDPSIGYLDDCFEKEQQQNQEQEQLYADVFDSGIEFQRIQGKLLQYRTTGRITELTLENEDEEDDSNSVRRRAANISISDQHSFLNTDPSMCNMASFIQQQQQQQQSKQNAYQKFSGYAHMQQQQQQQISAAPVGEDAYSYRTINNNSQKKVQKFSPK